MTADTVIQEKELISLVPHKGKMFLLSRVRAYNTEERTLTAEYDITPDCMFYDRKIDGIPSWVCFEFMAQSISALSGIAGRARGEKPKLGFILSVSNMSICAPVLKAGTTAVIQISEDCAVDMVFTFACAVFLDDKQIAAAKLTVMDTTDVSLIENR
ncbi:MAG: 3-hydroxylacyl-ACP dehydratase [Spirochaetales bacterium]|jgi:predicted hotdog family 3-hydroxylacyl-ACP dehydratase|nr:3-hydroxylacyl-ACP dehydratase [Spirochaetales bacterium]